MFLLATSFLKQQFQKKDMNIEKTKKDLYAIIEQQCDIDIVKEHIEEAEKTRFLHKLNGSSIDGQLQLMKYIKSITNS